MARRYDQIPEELTFRMFREAGFSGGYFQPSTEPWSLQPDTRERALGYPALDGIEVDYVGNDVLLVPRLIKGMVNEYLNGPESFGEMEVGLYQLWTLMDWIKPHNTPEAAAWFGNKLLEETCELIDEVRQVSTDLAQKRFENPELDLPGPKDKKVINELGDVLFVDTAIGDMLAVNVEEAAAHAMLDIYGRATRFPTLAEIDSIVIEGIKLRDDVHPQGLAPEFLQTLEYESPVVYGSEYHPENIIMYLNGVLIAPVHDLIERIGQVDMITGPGSPFSYSVADSLGKLWIFTAFYARVWANSSLQEVVRVNMLKINARVDEKSVEDRTARGDHH
jgi:NTP pyrophosphatase (non-canonical NTP hydrolase)